MAISKNIFYSFLYISFTLPIFSFAEDVTIITHDFPSKTEKWGENQIGGIAGEIISQAFKHKNITFKIIWEPWIRAQEDCLANTDSKSFIIPFTRNPDREKKYIWVSKIYNADTVFISYKGTKPINSLQEVKNKKIGVMLATSYETFLLNQKLMKQNIISVPKDSQNVNALEEKTIDAWYTSVIGALSFLKEQKLNIDYYTFGNKIDTEENYIATTKKTSEKLISKVKQAIESFKKTPQYSAIVRKYTGKNP
nr:basic amino acid ABC transporter substrate-binding protein [Pigmentibacter ruber]